MKIYNISPISSHKILLNLQDNKNINSNKNIENKSNKQYSYNPLAYQDYGISFSARLFRTPANFFEQDFNRKGMPETMKNYLFDDYEDRQNMPPAQMMRLVFDDINETKSLEQVKRIYPNEPLFNNLRDIPGRNARTGVIAEIELMKQDDKSLFKNGQNNLGLYLLKKIYLEGKTLKEINNDFQKDISVYYKGLSPIKYETLSAYGIKFPNSAFWKSFTATREDFPYEYKPRKLINPKNSAVSQTHKPKNIKSSEKKKFDNLREWEIDKLADTMVQNIGQNENAKKQINKLNIQDREALGFVAKYMSEINSVVLEKVHASDEMKDFYSNYDGLSNSQRKIFDAYWNSNPKIREQRSLAMKDTIKLFLDAYGVDGNNQEFKELIDYARSIKPLRLERKKEHDRIQTEYDDMFAKLDEEQKSISDSINEDKNTENLSKEDKNKVSYTVLPETHEIRFNEDLSEIFNDLMQEQMKLFPKSFAKKYMQYFLAHPSINDKYKLTMLVNTTIPDGYEDLIYPKDELDSISLNVNKDFTLKYPQVISSCNQALIELISKIQPNEACNMFNYDTDELVRTLDLVGVSELTDKQKIELDNNYHNYLRPVTSKEDINKINTMLINFVLNYQKSSSNDDEGVSSLIELLHANIKSNPRLEKDFIRIIKYSKFVENYGGSSRILLKNDVSDDIKNAKLELMIVDLMYKNVKSISNILSDNLYNVANILKNKEPEFFQLLAKINLENKNKQLFE